MSTERFNRVVVTGIGPVTSIGVGVEAFWRSLHQGRSNVGLRQLDIDFGQEIELPLASMAPALPIIKPHHEFLERIDYAGYRDLAYAMAAIDLALEDARFDYDRDDNTIGAIQAFEAPGMERAVAAMFEACAAINPNSTQPPKLYEKLAPAYYNSQGFLYVHAIGKAFGFHGFSTSVHNACSSAAFAIEIAAQRIRTGQTDCMIVAGGEAFDTGVRIEWFRQLGLYASKGRMRPFDADSAGFYAGEGGGALLLESLESATRRGAEPYAEYLGGSFAQQGWKHSIPDVRAKRLHAAIRSVLESHADTVSGVDLVVPHGASTPISDGYEADAISRGLPAPSGERPTRAVVFKPHVGHMLAASGIVELSAALLAMRHEMIPATLNSRPANGRLTVPLVVENTNQSIETLLKTSTGFTGHDAASLYKRIN